MVYQIVNGYHQRMQSTAITLSPVSANPLYLLKALVLDSVQSAHSKRAYERGLDRFLRWYEIERPLAGFSKGNDSAISNLPCGKRPVGIKPKRSNDRRPPLGDRSRR
jgi:hypothetical protein